jgi:hypothetical protein
LVNCRPAISVPSVAPPGITRIDTLRHVDFGAGGAVDVGGAVLVDGGGVGVRLGEALWWWRCRRCGEELTAVELGAAGELVVAMVVGVVAAELADGRCDGPRLTADVQADSSPTASIVTAARRHGRALVTSRSADRWSTAGC